MTPRAKRKHPCLPPLTSTEEEETEEEEEYSTQAESTEEDEITTIHEEAPHNAGGFKTGKFVFVS